jgi:hypothetical protein
VTVVIIGVSRRETRARRLYTEDADGTAVTRTVSNINPYLVPGENVMVEPQSRRRDGLPDMDRGNSPTDGGFLILERSEIAELHLTDEDHDRFLRPFVGSSELISGSERWCLWIDDDKAGEAYAIPHVARRIELVRAFRLASTKQATVKAAAWPHRFDERKPLPQTPVICVPITSSENRPYLPVGVLKAGTAISNLAFQMKIEALWPLALIASRMSLVWVSTVCSRMRTDFRYTNTLAWNTFPVPKLTEQDKADLTRTAENILLAREAHFPATIADLYDPEAMPDHLRRAHDENDEVLERIYIGRRFRNDTERLEKLFDLYTKMTADAPKAKKGKQAA